MNIYPEILSLTRNGPINLHLGCGGKHVNNCVNIDFPQEAQPLVKSAADISADIVQLDFPEESVDSIQLHHVFEHFSRGVALGLLVNWNRWLKIGGTLEITVPDIYECAKGIGSFCTPLSEKMKLIRHLAGSHEEDKWSFHLDQWFAERLQHTFKSLNFKQHTTKAFNRDNGVYDISIKGTKTEKWNGGILSVEVYKLLKESTLDPCEQPMLDIWYRKYQQTILIK